MAISTIAGASVAGLAWILKKNKVGSLLLGVATTMATFVISNWFFYQSFYDSSTWVYNLKFDVGLAKIRAT